MTRWLVALLLFLAAGFAHRWRRQAHPPAEGPCPELGSGEALRASEERFRATFEQAAVGIAHVTPDGRPRRVNERLCRFLGYSRGELLRLSVRDITYPDDLDADIANYEALIRGEVPSYTIEKRYRRKDGTLVWGNLTVSLVRRPSGEPDYLIAVVEDITARKQAERERDRLFELSQDSLAIAGFDGYFRDVNPAMVAAIDAPRDEILATPFIELVHPQDRAALAAALRRLNEGERAVRIETRCRHRDDWHWTAWHVTAVPEDGTLYGVGRDIHGMRLAEERLRQSQKMEAIGELTGGIAHDINNVLTAIIGNLDRILTKSAPDDPHRRLAESALRSGERASRLIQHLLAFARRQRLEPQVLRIDRTLHDMLPVLQHAAGPGIELTIELPEDLWFCRADPAQLEAAMLNLVINARDAMAGGGSIQIAARNVPIAAGSLRDITAGDYVRLTVGDTGSGMSEEELARAFEPFFTTKEVGKGSGLGLSMVYGFAKQSGGLARIESTRGAGTAVHLYLPRAAGPPETVATDRDSDDVTRGSATVLVVEDEDSVRHVTAEALEDGGYRVLRARNGQEAMAMLKSGAAVDLVVSDVAMPGALNGIELARESRRLRADLPFLLTTGYAAEPALAPLDHDQVEMLLKPYRPAQLRARVQRIIDRQHAEHQRP